MANTRVVGSTKFPFFKVKSDTDSAPTEQTPLISPAPPAVETGSSHSNHETHDPHKKKKSKKRPPKTPEIKLPETYLADMTEKVSESKRKFDLANLSPDSKTTGDTLFDEILELLNTLPIDENAIKTKFSEIEELIIQANIMADPIDQPPTSSDLPPPAPEAHVNTDPSDLRSELPTPPTSPILTQSKYDVLGKKKNRFSLFCCCGGNDSVSDDDDELSNDRRDENQHRQK